QRLEAAGIPEDPYRWYLDLRRYGSVPHSGFGLGVERIAKWVCNLEHIRDAIPYPRTVARVYP
ncbi:MAG TPA: asparagine--tRNA ligase, partial [Methanomassiliicoccales archaeon]|nr:asparagine--tRNA ligase [Methanomassiliicoccales archaeon]